nr:reverse transcriptase domain-containing protein [Tanacetum cinerariifolium]
MFQSRKHACGRCIRCMRVSGFMHGITYSELIKRLNNNIPKSVDEIMSVTTTFIRGEVALANQSRKKGLSAVKDKQEKDKIRSKPNKNEKRGEAGKSQKAVTVKRARKTEEDAS